MPGIGPISRRDLTAALWRAGFVGPSGRGNYQIMQRGDVTVWIPNPHRGDISSGFLIRILRQAGITREEWEAL